MRLIDADLLKWKLSLGAGPQDASFGRGVELAKTIIDEIPTIDNTNHSQWVINHMGDVYCYECGRLAPYAKAMHNVDGRYVACIIQLTDAEYCHHCGSKMKAVELMEDILE